MKSIRCIVLAVFVVAIVVGCSRLPQTTRSDEEMASIRAEYLQNNPDGKNNEHIMAGRVVRGMNVLEVLASWGLPNLRRGWKYDKTEYWTYYAKDEHTQQVVSYELVFEDKVLSRWIINQEPAGLGTAPDGSAVSRTVQETLRIGDVTTSGKAAAKKKK